MDEDWNVKHTLFLIALKRLFKCINFSAKTFLFAKGEILYKKVFFRAKGTVFQQFHRRIHFVPASAVLLKITSQVDCLVLTRK